MQHTQFRRVTLSIVSLLLFFTQILSSGTSRSAPRRPNILLIVSDDQRFDTMNYMPHTKERIFDQGMTFSRGYVTSPTCTPSRGSILTGMYAYKHGAVNNDKMLDKRTFVENLHDNGYNTALVGKLMNSWDGTPRPEYDFSAVFPNDVKPYPYTDPTLLVNDVRTPEKGYSTTILRDYAMQFLKDTDRQSEPFALIFAPNAPHLPAEPAPGDETLYPNLPPHRPPNFNEPDVSDKPRWLQGVPPLTRKQIAENDDFRRKQLQTLKPLDQSIDQMLDLLAAQGKLDDTIVIYLSDNGMFWGEHRGTNKQWVYEEASHVPFAIRYPSLIPTPRIEKGLVANIDIAPTVYQLAGLSIPQEVDGRSLVPLMKGTTFWRDALMIETNADFGHYYAVHTERYVYAELRYDRPELYDLQTDPYQLNNRINDPSLAPVATTLQRRLEQILGTLDGNTILANDVIGNPTDDTMQRKVIQAKSGTVVLFEQLGKKGLVGLHYTYSRNAAAPEPVWSTPTQVNTNATSLVAIEKDAADNIFLVVSQPGTNTSKTSLLFQKLSYSPVNDTPRATTSPWTPGPTIAIPQPTAASTVCCASLALDSQGVAWVASRSFDGTNYRIVVQSARGPAYTAWTTPIVLDTPSPSAHRTASVVAHGGKVSVVYYTGTYYASRWRDDSMLLTAPWNSEKIIEAVSLGANHAFSVASDAQGNLHLVYNGKDTSGIKYQRWDANTQTWGPKHGMIVSTRANPSRYGAASVTTVGNDVYVCSQEAIGPNQFILTLRRNIAGNWEAARKVLTDPWERAFDRVWSVSHGRWQNLTTVAASTATNDLRSSFSGALFDNVDDAVYLGMSERFDYVYTSVSTPGKGGSYTWEYWTGNMWEPLRLSENTNPTFAFSGNVRFRPPSDWQTRTINGENTPRYYVRVRTQIAPTTNPIGAQMTAVKNNRAPATLEHASSILPLAWTEGFSGVNSVKQRTMRPISAISTQERRAR